MNFNKKYKDIAIVIPSLEPRKELLIYIDKLIRNGFGKIIVINDGSSSEYDWIFEEISQKASCILLKHDKNQGKGQALKTGYKYIKENLTDFSGVITVDSDGQHDVQDVCNIAEEISMLGKYIILGTRDFSKDNVPFKSRFGNRFSSIMFFLLYGKWVSDTQTGLRAFDIDLLDKMIDIEGKRFEYEIQVLIYCANAKIDIKKIHIQTIYQDNNHSTHFEALKDSLSIMKVLFSSIGKYTLSSMISTLVDISIAWILMDFAYGSQYDFFRISFAIATARIISMTINFLINKNYVFKEKKKSIKPILKYAFLGATNIIISTVFVTMGFYLFNISEKTLKVIIDGILFFVNFWVQRIWVFKKENLI